MLDRNHYTELCGHVTTLTVMYVNKHPLKFLNNRPQLSTKTHTFSISTQCSLVTSTLLETDTITNVS